MKAFICLIALLMSFGAAYQLLQQIPITFGLKGNVSYTPTSGGVNIPGYILKIGFNSFSWIGIRFMALTSRSTYDVLVVQREGSSVGGYYKTTVTDFYMSSARTDRLMTDTNNNMDKAVTTYSNSNYYELQIFRTKGNTQGEDWEGGDFVDICFYTSSVAFSQNNWNNLKQSCYGYDVSINYISTFRGRSIATMVADNRNMQVYGGIEGPVLELRLFWYLPSANLSSSDVYIRTGDTISVDLGYDYFKCGSGDYFGPNIGSLTKDTLWSGYNDGLCTITSSGLSTQISFSKLVYTNDQFDIVISKQPNVCLTIGTSESCSTLKLQILFPVMSVDSALVIFQIFTQARFISMVVFGIIIGLL